MSIASFFCGNKYSSVRKTLKNQGKSPRAGKRKEADDELIPLEL